MQLETTQQELSTLRDQANLTTLELDAVQNAVADLVETLTYSEEAAVL